MVEDVLLLEVEETAYNGCKPRRRQNWYLQVRHEGIEGGGGHGKKSAERRGVQSAQRSTLDKRKSGAARSYRESQVSN